MPSRAHLAHRHRSGRCVPTQGLGTLRTHLVPLQLLHGFPFPPQALSKPRIRTKWSILLLCPTKHAATSGGPGRDPAGARRCWAAPNRSYRERARRSIGLARRRYWSENAPPVFVRLRGALGENRQDAPLLGEGGFRCYGTPPH